MRYKLETQTTKRLVVDRSGSGALRGVSVATSGPAIGHGFNLDEASIRQVAGMLPATKAHWSHGGIFGDQLAQYLGEWQNPSTSAFQLCRPCGLEVAGATCPKCSAPPETATRAVADLVFAPSAKLIAPDGLATNAVEYLMTRAEENPTTLGASIVFAGDIEKVGAASVARIKKLYGADIVAEPACNPVGLGVPAADPNVGKLEAMLARGWPVPKPRPEIPAPSAPRPSLPGPTAPKPVSLAETWATRLRGLGFKVKVDADGDIEKLYDRAGKELDPSALDEPPAPGSAEETRLRTLQAAGYRVRCKGGKITSAKTADGRPVDLSPILENRS